MNDIKKALNERENKCNDKVVYEYKRPKHPYKYSKLNDFEKERSFFYNFNIHFSCFC